MGKIQPVTTKGSVMVNPFLRSTKSNEAPKLKRAPTQNDCDLEMK